tara:strand:- start:7381 stop:7875 length:495 start_codon:yes stop_codon:yes gene_type:complete
MKINKIILLLFFICIHRYGYTKEEDTNQPIHISSNKQHVYLKENRIVFSGHVRVTQGSIHIEAENLTMIKNDNSKQKILIAQGQPATYSQVIDEHPAIASANKITYALEDKMVFLNGKANIKQQDSLVQGELITYNALDKEIIAQGNSDKSERVLTIFQPEKGL